MRSALELVGGHVGADVFAPYRVDTSVVRERVDAYFDGGMRDPCLVAVNTATLLFERHPDGSRATFPPRPGCRPEVRCVFDLVVAQVEGALRTRGLAPTDPQVHDGIEWRVVACGTGSPDLQIYPWEFPALHVDGLPAPGTACRVDPQISDTEFFRALSANALAMAGMDPSVAFDNDSKIARRLRKEMRDVVLASEWNDARITSSSATLAGGRDPGTQGSADPGVTHVLGPRGRGLVWRSWHYDDVGRIARGLPPKRGVSYDGQPRGSGRSPMTIYTPAINLAALRGPAPTVTVEGMAWSDGSSTLEPPPVVARLGIDTGEAGAS